MNFDEAMVIVRAESNRLKAERQQGMTITKAMQMLWDLADVERLRLSVELLARMEAPAAPAAPAPVSGDAEAVARLTRVTPHDPRLGTLPGLRDD